MGQKIIGFFVLITKMCIELLSNNLHTAVYILHCVCFCLVMLMHIFRGQIPTKVVFHSF